MGRAICRGERRLVRPCDQRPVKPIAPAVIGAAEILLATAAALGDSGAAMAADIEKAAQFAVAAARQQDRDTRIIMRHPVAGVRQERRQADIERALTEEPLAL